MKRICSILFTVIFCILHVHAQETEYPKCVHLDKCSLHFPGARDSEDLLNSKIKAHLDNPDRNITIWHIGGSHVQAGYFPERLRSNFCSLNDGSEGEIGFIFPYPAIHTNFSHSYDIRCEGEWIGNLSSKPKRNLPSPEWGIMGIAASTSDTTACICFKLGEEWPVSSLRLMGYGSSEDVMPYVLTGRDSIAFRPDTLVRGYIVDFPETRDSVKIIFDMKEGDSFTLTGIQPISGRFGINYYASGVNGARTSTWLDKCPEMWREFELVNPDLAILGLGINDSACSSRDFNPEKFKNNYRRLVAKIRDSAPDCALILITNNDSYRYSRRRMVHNDNGLAVQKAMYELAEEFGAAVWDLFDIMGGNKSVTEWRDAELVRPDRLHFTKEGYKMLGDLLFKAIMEDCNKDLEQDNV